MRFRARAQGPVPALTGVTSNRGVRSSGVWLKGARSIRALQAREMIGRVNASESLMMPRHRRPQGWDAMPGCRGWPLENGR